MKKTTPKKNGRNHASRRRKVMRLPKTEVERRRKVAIDYFTKNPNATGDSFLKALTSGQLTGKKEPALNIKKVYDIRGEARKAVAEKEKPPTIPQSEFANARRDVRSLAVAGAPTTPSLTEAARKHIAGLIHEFPNIPGTVADILVRRDGKVVLGRLARTEEQVTFSEPQAAQA